MIVIEKQPHNENKHYRIICTCGCVFTCDDTDWYHNCITGHGERDDVISCPICSKNLYKSLVMSGVNAKIELLSK